MTESAFVALVGASGVLLVGAITIWSSLASGNRKVPLWLKLAALLGAIGVFGFGAGMLRPGGEPVVGGGPPTPPAVPGEPKKPNSGGGAIVYAWDFNSDDGRWLLDPASKLGSTESMRVADGKLQVDFRSGAGQYVNVIHADVPQLLDVEVHALLERLGGPDTMAYGLIFRDNNEQGNVYFLINGRRQFGVFAHVKGPNEHVDTLVPWTQSGVINSDAPNQLSVISLGRQISVFANNQPLTTFNYDPLFSGSAGVLVTLYGPNETGTIAIDDFRISRAP